MSEVINFIKNAEVKKQLRAIRSHKFDKLPRQQRYIRIRLAGRYPMSPKALPGDVWLPADPKPGSRYQPHQGKKEMAKRARIPLSATCAPC